MDPTRAKAPTFRSHRRRGSTIAFTAYSGIVVAEQGYFGFLSLARREPWGLQMLLDLTIMIVLFLVWARGDARQRGLPFWPFAVVTVALGSIGALGYLIVRSIKSR